MISNIRLQNFRSYADESFEFDSGVNIVVGPNASGKTNLLEAVLLICSGSSYRAKDGDLIKFGQDWARLDADTSKSHRTVKLKQDNESLIKSYTIDDKEKKRLIVTDSIPVVVFEPNHLLLLISGPDFRRQYFDDILVRTDDRYKKALNNYKRALAQRNALLKQNPSFIASQLFVWNIRLSDLGAYIVSKRLDLLKKFNAKIEDVYSQVAHKPSRVELSYKSKIADLENYSSAMLAMLEKSQSLDFRRGFTTVGPHRDDFEITLNGQLAELIASRGETRTILLSLKVIELEFLELTNSQKPVLLLDDVFSELDSSRRRYLVDYLKNQQTIITTTDADAVVNYFSSNHKLIAL